MHIRLVQLTSTLKTQSLLNLSLMLLSSSSSSNDILNITLL